MAEFPDPGVIESLLEGLANRAGGAIVAQLAREPNRRDSRWAQLFEELPASAVVATADEARGWQVRTMRHVARAPSNAELVARVAELEAEIAALARRARRTQTGSRRVNLPAWAQSAGLLIVSNVFMTFAWYAHLKNMAAKPWVIAALVSWGIALFEYLVQVPANRIGYTTMSLGQLKVMQEVITLAVFVPFALFYMKQPLKLDFLWAGLCLVAAAYFMFREAKLTTAASRARRTTHRRLPRAYPRNTRSALRPSRRDPRDRSRTPSTAPRCALRPAS